ncbi:PEGA domain-containing protein [Treponema sp.]|uniref:PEGA domain-containing protein n=1 Tax=Treponema sp. TaxID=166 RepID=UPI0025CE7228|nr:PEGA domain-containing protein [Treponema sp.]MCR5218131.1 PEGA domain-containing protein [Treponema sp.]
MLVFSAAFMSFTQTASKVKPLVLENQTSPDCYVKVDTNVYGASVYIDGKYEGTTPLYSKKVSKGHHTLRITKTHYATKELSFYVREGETKSFVLDLENISAWLTINTNPSDAKVYVDNDLVTSSRVEIDEGNHTVKVSKFGYDSSISSFYISRKQTKNLDITLKKAIFNIISISSSRKAFNPDNKGDMGSTLIEFEVNAPENGTLQIADSEGNVYVSEDYSFTQSNYSYRWDGSDGEGYIAYDGTYTATLTAGGKSASCKFKIDSSISYHALTMTSQGTGMGSSALPLPLPDTTLIAGISSGAYFHGPVTESDDTFYSVPLNGFLAFATPNVEVGFNFNAWFKKNAAMGCGLTVKLQNQTEVAEGTSFNYGLNFRWAASNYPVLEPFGADSGNGLGAGIMAGFDIDGLYIGANSTYIFYPVSLGGPKGTDWDNADEGIWKNGITLTKNMRDYEAAIYANLISSFGTYSTEYEDSNGNLYRISEKIEDWQRAWDAGFAFNAYLGSSNHTLNFNAGVILYPEEEESYVYAKLGLTFLFL